MIKFLLPLKRIVKGEEGATMVEYGLMLALIAIVCIASVALIGSAASTTFNTAANTL